MVSLLFNCIELSDYSSVGLAWVGIDDHLSPSACEHHMAIDHHDISKDIAWVRVGSNGLHELAHGLGFVSGFVGAE